MSRKFVSLALVVASAIGFSACSNDSNDSDDLRLSGGVEDFVIDQKYTEFCAAYDELNVAINDMSDLGSTKATFGIVLEKSKALVEASPDDIADAVLSNDAILNAMNQAFAERGYDEEKISADEGLRQEVQRLYAQDGLPELTSKYADYLVTNCGVSVEAE